MYVTKTQKVVAQSYYTREIILPHDYTRYGLTVVSSWHYSPLLFVENFIGRVLRSDTQHEYRTLILRNILNLAKNQNA